MTKTDVLTEMLVGEKGAIRLLSLIRQETLLPRSGWEDQPHGREKK